MGIELQGICIHTSQAWKLHGQEDYIMTEKNDKKGMVYVVSIIGLSMFARTLH